MVLKPIAESLLNVMELIDKNPDKLLKSEYFSKEGTGVNSYTIDRAVKEGHLFNDGMGNYSLTTKGVDLLNQMRLKRAIENFDKTSSKYSKILIIVGIFTLIATLINIFTSLK